MTDKVRNGFDQLLFRLTTALNRKQQSRLASSWRWAKGGPLYRSASPVKSPELANHHDRLTHFGGDNGGDLATVAHAV